jgi:hypothetical protein
LADEKPKSRTYEKHKDNYNCHDRQWYPRVVDIASATVPESGLYDPVLEKAYQTGIEVIG